PRLFFRIGVSKSGRSGTDRRVSVPKSTDAGFPMAGCPFYQTRERPAWAWQPFTPYHRTPRTYVRG
ncbi:MAG: hypothetical protein ACE5I0_04465, partial [Candidatus Binatia bacterium]